MIHNGTLTKIVRAQMSGEDLTLDQVLYPDKRDSVRENKAHF